MSNALDIGSTALGGNFSYGGLACSDTFYDNGAFSGSLFQTYAGTANNQNVAVPQNVISTTGLFQPYAGYGISYTGVVAAPPSQANGLSDNMPVLSYPKNQQIYYKLVGYNTSTQSFETWVIAEEIVPRPETFDPTANFPNFDYGVFFSPPSGHQLVNIKIVGRWIQ